MSSELYLTWREIQTGLFEPVVLWQLFAIAVSLLLAWSVNGLLHARIKSHAPLSWRAGDFDRIDRVLYPLSALLFVYISQLALGHWYHVSLLRLAIILLAALVVIRVAIYALRYTFAASGWVRPLESAIRLVVWLVVVLHLGSLLPDMLALLDSIKVGIGKSQLSVLLLLQATLIIFITLMLALWISRLIENRLLGATRLNMNLRVVLGKVVRILLSLIAILLALSIVGVDITLLSIFGGALGVGLGFGLQKIASNYVSGFIILLDDSLHIGDFVTIDQHYGRVNELRSRYMVLRKGDNTKVIIPNETLVTNVMLNHTMQDRNVRLQLPIRVGYETDLDLALKLLLDAAGEQRRVLSQPAASALLKEFGESGIELQLNVWINDPESGTAGLQSELYLAIWRAFKQHGIVIPYPQREIRVLDSARAD